MTWCVNDIAMKMPQWIMVHHSNYGMAYPDITLQVIQNTFDTCIFKAYCKTLYLDSYQQCFYTICAIACTSFWLTLALWDYHQKIYAKPCIYSKHLEFASRTQTGQDKMYKLTLWNGSRIFLSRMGVGVSKKLNIFLKALKKG